MQWIWGCCNVDWNRRHEIGKNSILFRHCCLVDRARDMHIAVERQAQ